MLSTFNQFVVSHLHAIVWALVATMMMLYGAHLNQRLRRILRPLPWVLRILAFIVICGVGYGWLSLVIVDVAVSLLVRLRPLAVSLVLLACFLSVGVLAERRRMI